MVKTEDEIMISAVKNIALIAGILLLIVIGFVTSFYTVQGTERGVLLTWGKPHPVPIQSGAHFKIPIAQSVIKMDVRTQKYATTASAASKDLQGVQANLAVNYRVIDTAVVDMYTGIGLNYEEKIIQPAVQETVKAVTAQFTAEELITKRELVKERIDELLKARLVKQHIMMETTSITNFDFSAQFNQAIEAKVTAEQNALTEKNRLAMIEFQAQQKIAEAEGQANSTILRAQAEAQSKLLNAEAEAKSLELQKEQITPQLLELRKIEVQKKFAEEWDGKLPQYMLQGALPIMQLPTMNSS